MLAWVLNQLVLLSAMDVKTVAVIGAGVSGVSSAIHLRNAGLDVTVFERGDVAGGVWCVAFIPDSSFLPIPSVQVRNLRKHQADNIDAGYTILARL